MYVRTCYQFISVCFRFVVTPQQFKKLEEKKNITKSMADTVFVCMYFKVGPVKKDVCLERDDVPNLFVFY